MSRLLGVAGTLEALGLGQDALGVHLIEQLLECGVPARFGRGQPVSLIGPADIGSDAPTHRTLGRGQWIDGHAAATLLGSRAALAHCCLTRSVSSSSTGADQYSILLPMLSAAHAKRPRVPVAYRDTVTAARPSDRPTRRAHATSLSSSVPVGNSVAGSQRQCRLWSCRQDPVPCASARNRPAGRWQRRQRTSTSGSGILSRPNLISGHRA